MKILLSTLLILTFSSFLFGQAADSKPSSQTIKWDNNLSCCSNYMKKNRLVTRYEDESLGFLITVDAESEDKYIIFEISFLNKSEKSFTIYPDKFSLLMTEPINKKYLLVSSEDVAKKMENRGRWRMALAAGLSGMATQQSSATVRDNEGNNANVVVTQPDTQAQQNVRDANNRRKTDNQSKADAIREYSLPAHTLFKGENVGGFLFFKKEKMGKGMIFSFEIQGVTYEVPFGSERMKLVEIKK